MAIDIRFPQITETTVEGQLRQLKSCLIQYSEKLNWALNTLEKNTNDVVVQYQSQSSAKASQEASPEQMASTFTALKGYIIKSADIVNAYSDVITKNLEGIYTAEATFPDGSSAAYISKTKQSIDANSEELTKHYTSIQNLETKLEATAKSIESDGYIKEGVIRYVTDGKLEGAPIIGIEVGQEIVKDGVKKFNRFSQLTANGLEFYDSQYSNGKEPVSYIKGYKMYVTTAEIKELYLGGYELDTSDGIMFLWNDELEEEKMTIIVEAFGSSNQADVALYINDENVKSYSGAHTNDTLSYTDVTAAYIELTMNSVGFVYVSTDGEEWTEAFNSDSQVGATFDLMTLESDTVYIRHAYFDF